MHALPLIIADSASCIGNRARLTDATVLPTVTGITKALAMLTEPARRTVVRTVPHESTLAAEPAWIAGARLLAARTMASTIVKMYTGAGCVAPAILLGFPFRIALTLALHTCTMVATLHALASGKGGLSWTWHWLMAVIPLEASAAHTSTVVAYAVLTACTRTLADFITRYPLVTNITHANSLGLPRNHANAARPMLTALWCPKGAVVAWLLAYGRSTVCPRIFWVTVALAMSAHAMVAARIGALHSATAVLAHKPRGTIAPANLAITVA